MMAAKLVYLLMVLSVLGAVLKESGAEVLIPFPVDSLLASSGLNSLCNVKNESFIGWFKVNGNVKIDVMRNRNAIIEKPGVVIRTINRHEKTATLIIPRWSPKSAGGRYKCKGDKNEAILEVLVRFNLDSLQTNQSLPLGYSGKIILGALAYPLAKISWKKDGVAINFAANPRLTMENDGSITFSKVRVSDAGVYEANVNWENRNFADKTVTVHVVAPTPPIITTPLRNQTVTKGDPIRLLCKATCIPAPRVSWSKADGTINPSYVSGNVLMIPRAEVSDAGKYICTARNDVATTTAEAIVRVKLQPHSPLPLSAQLTHLAIKIYWKEPESHGYPVLMYSVHKVELDPAGQEVTSHTYHVNEDVHHYKVTGIKGGNTYKFYVTAWNTHGESVKDQSKSVTVKVQKP